jgi:hypothetical protein
MRRKWDREEGIGGWGYRTRLTENQRAEIDTCLDCPLPDCRTVDSPKCPLNRTERVRRTKRDVERLIAAWWEATRYVS